MLLQSCVFWRVIPTFLPIRGVSPELSPNLFRFSFRNIIGNSPLVAKRFARGTDEYLGLWRELLFPLSWYSTHLVVRNLPTWLQGSQILCSSKLPNQIQNFAKLRFPHVFVLAVGFVIGPRIFSVLHYETLFELERARGVKTSGVKTFLKSVLFFLQSLCFLFVIYRFRYSFLVAAAGITQR
jgi:hypothetical protein